MYSYLRTPGISSGMGPKYMSPCELEGEADVVLLY